jgi:DNA end-binding protein Ku
MIMAPRPFWKGYLKLSLVTCPVALTPATSDGARLRFHVLNRETGNRVVSRYLDAQDETPVEEDNLVKGYAKGEDDYVLFEDEELKALALKSTATIDIESFVPADDIDPIWYDRPLYLTPNDPVGEEAFAVIRDAMKATGTAGLSRIVLFQRERPVMVKPLGAPNDKGMIVWTLRYADEIRDAREVFGQFPEPKVDTSALDLIGELIDKLGARWDPKLARDPVQEKQAELIANRRKGGKAPAKARETAAPASNVVDIFEALRKSIRAASKPS